MNKKPISHPKNFTKAQLYNELVEEARRTAGYAQTLNAIRETLRSKIYAYTGTMPLAHSGPESLLLEFSAACDNIRYARYDADKANTNLRDEVESLQSQIEELQHRARNFEHKYMRHVTDAFAEGYEARGEGFDWAESTARQRAFGGAV